MQSRAVEELAHLLILVSFLAQAVSFIAGFTLQDLRVTFGLYGAIVVLLALVSVRGFSARYVVSDLVR